jgi:hypothetical protein
MDSIRLICIDDKNRPSDIPASKWIKEEEQYTLVYIKTSTHPKTLNEMMFELAEITLDEPYGGFKATRFAINIEDLEAFKELLTMCSEMNDIEIEHITKEIEIFS